MTDVTWPTQQATREEMFSCLCADFSLHNEVKQEILNAGIQNLEEFRFYFTDESEIAPWLADCALDDVRRINETGLRRAWHSVRQSSSSREADRTRSNIVDFDDSLDENSLNDVKL